MCIRDRYRPQSDGMIEQANRTIENMLSDFVNDTQQDWEEYIPLLMMGYKSSIHEALVLMKWYVVDQSSYLLIWCLVSQTLK